MKSIGLSKEKAKEIEQYFQTENEHYNEATFELYLEAEAIGTFEDIATPLALFDKYVKKFVEGADTPIQTIQDFLTDIDSAKFDKEQSYTLMHSLLQYLNYSDFGEEVSVEDLRTILHLKTDELKQILNPDTPSLKTTDLRMTLKAVFEKELSQLPETLASLEPLERLKMMTKLMPYIFPKLNSANHWVGE